MKKKLKKQAITIEVVPEFAGATIGLLRGIFPSIIEQLERQGIATLGERFKFSKVEKMQEVLDEIYEKCIAKTTIREEVQELIKKEGMVI